MWCCRPYHELGEIQGTGTVHVLNDTIVFVKLSLMEMLAKCKERVCSKSLIKSIECYQICNILSLKLI